MSWWKRKEQSKTISDALVEMAQNESKRRTELHEKQIEAMDALIKDTSEMKDNVISRETFEKAVIYMRDQIEELGAKTLRINAKLDEIDDKISKQSRLIFKVFNLFADKAEEEGAVTDDVCTTTKSSSKKSPK